METLGDMAGDLNDFTPRYTAAVSDWARGKPLVWDVTVPDILAGRTRSYQ